MALTTRIDDCTWAASSSVAANGGTATLAVASVANSVLLIVAECFGVSGVGGFYAHASCCVVQNAGSAALVSAGTGQDPFTYGDGACDSNYRSGGGAASTIAWSVSGANAVFTITNQSTSARDFLTKVRAVTVGP